MHVLVTHADGSESEAFLIDVLPRHHVPSRRLVDRYYGEGAPPSVYRAVGVGRLVFAVFTGGYYIIADNPVGQQYWRFFRGAHVN